MRAIDKMTTYDYNIVMIEVKIATLKAKLSYYLGQVRNGGELLIFDRKTPVARVVAARATGEKLVITEATKPLTDIDKMKFKPLKKKTDSTKLLREDRNRR